MKLQKYQMERIDVMKKVLSCLGDNFILKGGTALLLYYGLDRFSEDIDLDSRTRNMDITKSLNNLIKKEGWNYHIKKNTDTTFRVMIDYGGKNKGDQL